MSPLRLLVAAAAVAAAVALFFVLRPEDEDAARTTTALITQPPRVEGRQKTERWRIDDASQIARLRVPKNTIVTLTVDLDVQDEVHVHGYDLRAPMSPDRPARFEFETKNTGRFEVELEQEHRTIGQLTVVP